MSDTFEQLVTALHAVDDAVKAGARQGEIPCPICKTGTLQYRAPSKRGARDGRGCCSTPGCVRWLS